MEVKVSEKVQKSFFNGKVDVLPIQILSEEPYKIVDEKLVILVYFFANLLDESYAGVFIISKEI